MHNNTPIHNKNTPIAVTIAGSDSGGGAGIQADLKTFSALGAYGATVITALTAQNTLGVQGIHGIPTDFISQQMDSVYTDLSVSATKIGMLATSDVIETIAHNLSTHTTNPIILDPVMVAESGDSLLENSAVETLKSVLFPMATLITPNLHESAHILGCDMATTIGEMKKQAEQLLTLGSQSVLVKGGHFVGESATDVLLSPDGFKQFTAPRFNTNNTHGTGCSLSSAITAYVAQGQALDTAVDNAKIWISNAIQHADTLSIGQGYGPVHHFHGIWG